MPIRTHASRRRAVAAVLPTMLLPALAPAILAAQERPMSVSLGGGWPNGSGMLERRWRDAWLARGAVTLGSAETRRARLRLAYEVSRWDGADPARPRLTDRALLIEGLFGPRGDYRLHPYLLLGIGQHALAVPGYDNPDGSTWGTAAGLGLSLRRLPRECALDLEARRRIVLTDYSLGDFNFHVSGPVMLVLRC